MSAGRSLLRFSFTMTEFNVYLHLLGVYMFIAVQAVHMLHPEALKEGRGWWVALIFFVVYSVL
jgi:hypothetical protein